MTGAPKSSGEVTLVALPQSWKPSSYSPAPSTRTAQCVHAPYDNNIHDEKFVPSDNISLAAGEMTRHSANFSRLSTPCANAAFTSTRTGCHRPCASTFAACVCVGGGCGWVGVQTPLVGAASQNKNGRAQRPAGFHFHCSLAVQNWKLYCDSHL